MVQSSASLSGRHRSNRVAWRNRAPVNWSYDTSTTTPGVTATHDRSLSALQRLSPPGRRTVSADPKSTVAALKKEPGKDIWLFGGGELFRSFVDLGLVDGMEVAIVPVLLGGGLPMLPAGKLLLSKLKLTSHRVYEKTGTVLLHYAM